MKKLATFVFAFLLAASLSFAQNTGDQPKGKTDTTHGKNAKSGKKGHKGGKKSKKSSGGTSTPAPK